MIEAQVSRVYNIHELGQKFGSEFLSTTGKKKAPPGT